MENTIESPTLETPATATPTAELVYTRHDLMSARHVVLSTKRTARQGGFGAVAGRMIREAVGYKFDNMSVDAVLVELDTPKFLAEYKLKLDQWYAGLNKSATADTLKKNAAAYKTADALNADPHSFSLLVKALRVLCVRNQSWVENGNNLTLPMNGHKALLDLFGINVTNARRLSLATA